MATYYISTTGSDAPAVIGSEASPWATLSYAISHADATAVTISGGGSGYSDGTGIATTGGTGTGLKVDITTVAGAITAATVDEAGTGYTDGDIVTVDGGTGGTLEVTGPFALADGDTIKVKDGTYVETVETEINLSNLTITSESGDKSTVTISNTLNQYWINLWKGTTGTVIKDLTFTQMSTVGSYSVCFRGYIGGSGTYAVATFQDCNINAIERAFENFGSGTVIQRCAISAMGSGTSKMYAIQLSGLSTNVTIDSCLIKDFYKYGIYASNNDSGGTPARTTIRNCTIISPEDPLDGAYGILTYGTENTILNTVVYSYQTGGDEGYDYAVRFGVSSQATTQGRMLVAAGVYTQAYWLREGAPTVTEQLETQVPNVEDPPYNGALFVDLAGGDYHPDPAGILYQRGYATSFPATDLNGNAFNNPPSIGCLEEEPSGGGGPTNSVVKSMGGGLLSSPFTLTP